MTRKELQKFEGQLIYATAIRGRVSYAIERISQPKVVILDVQIMDTDISFDHCWVAYRKKLCTVSRKQLFSFSARVLKYQSIDEKGNRVEKYGLAELKQITIEKNRDDLPKRIAQRGKDSRMKRRRKRKEKGVA
jgi:hypothetical protein